MTDAQLLAPERRRRRQRAVDRLAVPQAGIVHRQALYAAGLTRAEVRAQVAARRWRRCGTHAIAVFTGPLDERARLWVAVLEGGPRAMLDGASSLQVAGLQRFEARRIRVTVPRGARIRHRPSGIDIRQTRRWSADDVEPGSPLPRTRNAVAAVRGFLWAGSVKEGTLLVTMAVQQRLVTPELLAEQALRIRRDPRRDLLHQLIADLAGGVQSLGELDVKRACERRGLPAPTSQRLVRTPRGTCYLDLRWDEYALVVEVDGIHHLWAEAVVADSLRHNDVALGDRVVLRLPLLGLRLAPDAFFDQVERALRAGGWRPDLAA